MACCTLPWGPPQSTGTGQSAPRASTGGTSPVDEENNEILTSTSCHSSLPLPGTTCACGATGSAMGHSSRRLAQVLGTDWGELRGRTHREQPPQQDSYPAHLAQLCQHHHDGGIVLPEHPPEIFCGLGQRSLRGNVGLLLPVTDKRVLTPAP